MDELIGKQGHSLAGDYNTRSERVASESTKSIEEDIISQSFN